MEPESDSAGCRVKGEEPEDGKATKQSPVKSGIVPARRIRERGVGRKRTGASASPDTNGDSAVSQSQISGRVLRDRSTRTIPAWLRSDQSDDGEDVIPDVSANRRRKVPRKKNSSTEIVWDGSGQPQHSSCSEPKEVTDDPAPLSRRSQARTKVPLACSVRSSRGLFKSEPGEDHADVEEEAMVTAERGSGKEKKEEASEDESNLLEDPSFQDDLSDLNYQPQSQRHAENQEFSSDEDVPFADDLNDQSYNPRSDREAPKLRGRPPARKREKKEKEQEKEKELDIKKEGGESVQDVKSESELGEVTQEPRKRGRRRKDDKTPRLPKRRKKPPVQYVRCEMEGCGTVLAHPRYLQHHIKYQHLLKKKYVCPHPTCGRLFRLQKQLLRHAKHHTDQRDYICEFCARAFKSSHNLAVHRMIHTGEKPLHKKFEKKDSVVAHKAKSHPEVLIAEALAANAGALITTPTSLLEAQGNPVQSKQVQVVQVAQLSMLETVNQQSGEAGPVNQLVGEEGPAYEQVGQMSHQVVVLGQDQNLHTMQVPVTLALSAAGPPSPTANPQKTQLQFQMPLQFVQTATAQRLQQQPQIQQLTLHPSSVVTQHQAQVQHLPLQSYQQQPQEGQTPILHMTFEPISQLQTHIQQSPCLVSPQHLHTLPTVPQTSASSPTLLPQDPDSTNGESYILDGPTLSSSSTFSVNTLHPVNTMGEIGKAWEQNGEGLVLANCTEKQMGHTLI
ncbi:E3 ubiquitin-protein ligase ZFP91 isoform X3 [Hypomesus transpacificus]|uniref:E3 ubiquitin-protein ligase ZFP91 isoform X3 n=1 Tax=Hypomesus transpacificus TaxID=137520 RepID=UPI001F08482B|nr:E3 ubiquitin-protein ligase ZFP91 isoform X3 [Hypomesus transpacificus]